MTTNNSRTKTGRAGEDLALQYLKKQSLTLVRRNFRSRFGEIDLIMRDKNTIIFIEVRSRKNNFFLDPIETIDYSKRNKIIKTSQIFMQNTSSSNQFDWRFDVVTLTGRGHNMKIEWIKAAF